MFLEKTEKGIQNLVRLGEDYPFVRTKLLLAYQWSRRTGLKYPIRWFFWIFKNRIEKNLRSDHPGLKWFDFYKLGKMVGELGMKNRD